MRRRISSHLEIHRRIDPITLKDELERIFPPYTVTYSVMTDIFKIRHQRFNHKLEYNPHTSSRLVSEHLRVGKFTMVYNLGLIALVLVMIFLDQRLSWNLLPDELGLDYYMLGFVGLLGLMQNLVLVLKPGLKRELEAEHVHVRHTLERLLT